MKNRYQVTNTFKELCKAEGNINREAKIHIIEDNIDITGDDKLVDFTIEDKVCIDGKFVGTTVSKKATINILNPSNLINLENKEVEIYTGIRINNVIEWIPFGNYIIPKPTNKEVKEKTSFIGYDYMQKFNKVYKDNNTYPISLNNYFKNLCTQVGLQAGNDIEVNSTYSILGNPFTNNETCKIVLSNIAQLAGGFARIGRDNKVYIENLNPNNITEEIDGYNYLTDFEKNNEYGEINSVVIGISGVDGENTSRQDDESIRRYGLTEIEINDNYFLTEEAERERVIDEIYNKLKGIKYLPFSVSYYGYPYIDAGDCINIYDSSDTEYLTYVLGHTFKYDGHFSGKLQTEALTKTEEKIKTPENIKTKFRNVQLKVDKINGEISSVIEQQEEYEAQMSEVVQTVDELKQTVEETIDYKRKAENTNELHITDSLKNGLIRFIAKGYREYNWTLYPHSIVYPQNELYPNSPFDYSEVN